MSYVLKARAIDGEHYVELHVTDRARRMTGAQRDSLVLAMQHLLCATKPAEPVALDQIEVGIAELPQIDDDLNWGDPTGRLVLP